MHNNKKYDRLFIILGPESGGYVAEGQKLAGSAVLEVRNGKGKVSANIQGLKPIPNGMYKLYMVSSLDNDTLGVPIGFVSPDTKGKYVKTWEFDPQNVGGSKLDYDKFNVIAVVVKITGSSHNEIIAPLVGYRDNVVIWKSGFREIQKDSGEEPPKPGISKHERLTDGPPKPPAASSESEKVIPLAPLVGEGQDALIAKTIDRLKAVAEGEHLAGIENALQTMESALPAETSGKLIKALSIIMDYVPSDTYSPIIQLLKEVHDFEPGDDYDPFVEMLGIVEDLIPGKVSEAFTEAANEAIPHLNKAHTEKTARLAAMLQKTEKYFTDKYKAGGAQTEKRRESHADGDTAQEEYGETLVFHKIEDGGEQNADKRFRETFVSINDKFDGLINGSRFGEEDNQPQKQQEGGLDIQDSFNEDDLMEMFGERPEMFPFPTSNAPPSPYTPDDSYDERHMPVFPPQRPGFPPQRPGHPPQKPDFPQSPGFPQKPGRPPHIHQSNIRWVRITQKDMHLLPMSVWKYANHPFVAIGYKKYLHFILGVSGGGKRKTYYFGVPGVFSVRDRHRADELGFTGFLPVDGDRPKEGEFGYWIMEIYK